MQQQITVRVLGPHDAEVLDRVADDVFDHDIIPEQVRRFLEDPRHVLVVALADGVVVGMTSAVEYFHPDKQPALWINEVGVAPAFQRRGAARAMLEAVLAAARARECTIAWVGTEIDNAPARGLYAATGATIECEQFVEYEWSLEPPADD